MNRYREAAAYIRQKTDFEPEIALVLGSGLGGFAKNVKITAEIGYEEIPDFVRSTVQGHRGRFLLGTLENRRVIVLDGRVHYYEVRDMAEAVLPVRTAGLLGAKTLLLTNAAGGIRPDMRPGDFMLISDHISSFVPSPLLGPNDDELGPRFQDMSEAWDPILREKIRTAAAAAGIPLLQGVYCQLPGPQFESPAEIRMLRTLGADAVGMSTAAECIAARHMGLRVAGISCISNLAAGISASELSHEEVQETANRVLDSFERLILAVLRVL